MKTIVIVGGIVLAGAAFIAVVQSDKKKETAPVHQSGDGHQHDAASAGGAALLNPAHGEAGHRCDLPVGAPLNSPAAAPQSPAINMNQVPQATGATPKTNPAHGMPGHRCELPVGAPLT